MKFPLNASQTIAATAIAACLLGGAFALGKMNNGKDGAEAGREAVEATTPKSGQTLAKADSKPILCKGCWQVASVHTEERAGKGSGVGAVGGAVVGALIGNQIGGGNGKKIATVGGAMAGGYAGNEIEKDRNARKVWIVKLDDGQGHLRNHEQASNPNLQVGDSVELRDGLLVRR
ncbi:glycine zipper 2TM domain-containing protein [Pelomonas sp. SE-A7]|uniref:glycine zipper 2TM domain-containing protein n=1 Tax=Pelomonas sp. SE-A7 TaxID=3054953 RepID=UPI00259C7D8E|nr:glycine zipper 2TM domain-containing protein [Pelomonas sp. SE-A7]MDM4768255.1 glycine zipper 2TM domain-containing protein [Pelomonas sp. SE-A7]